MSEMSINAQFTADTKNFEAGIKKAQSALTSFGKTLSNATGKLNKGLEGWGISFTQFYDKGSSVLKNFGIDVDKFAAKLGMSGPVIAGITAVTVAVTKMGQEFNSAMAEIAKGTGATGETLVEFNENLQNLMISGVGSSMADIATNIADVNTRFGATGEELETLVDQFDQFSNVTGQNVHQAVNDVADVINKWGMETKDIKPLLDQLTKAGQDSGVSVQFLAQTLTQSKTVFTQFGMSATTSIAFVEQLAKAGVDTNTAMTGMRYALSKFSAEGKNSQKAFAEIGDAIRNAETDSEALIIALEAFGSKAGAEMINVFRNGKYSIDDFTKSLRSAGGVVEATDRATKTSKDAMSELLNTLKGMTSGFGQGFDVIFRDLLNSLQMVAGIVAPIIQPIGNAFRDVVSVVTGSAKQVIALVVEVVTTIKNIFVKSDLVKFVHKILKDFFGVFEDVFGLIIAILQGKWKLAWEYAKNAMLKVCDAILNALSGWLNNMKVPVNGFIKYVINPLIDAWNFLHILSKDKVDKIEPIGEIDLSGLTGLTSAITESNNKIAELTGKTTKQIIGDLGQVKDVVSSTANSVEKDASKSLSTVSQWEQKLIQQEIDRLKREKENAVIKAENEKKSEKKIYDIKKGYDDKIIALQIQKLELDKKAALEQITDAKEIERVNKYYENEILALKEQNVERIKEIQEQASQWETKLLAQRIAILEQEENMKIEEAKAAGKTESEIYQISKNYSVKIINLKIEQLNNQKAVDLAMATSAADRAKIVEYYEKQITYVTNQETAARKSANDDENDEEAKNYGKIVAHAMAAARAISNVFGKLTQVTKKIVSGVATAVKGLFSSITAFATNAFKGIAKGLKKAFDFNPDEALNAVLEFEDKILTFFTQTLPKLPKFFESVMSSIVHLVDSLIKNINMDELAKIIESILTTIVTYLPEIIAKAIPLIVRLVETICTTLVKNAPKIVNAIGQILQAIAKAIPQLLPQIVSLVVALFEGIAKVLTDNAQIIVEAIGSVIMAIINNLPRILKALVSAILTLIKEIAAYIVNNQDQIAQDFSDIVKAIVDSISEFVQNGGWKKLLEAIVAIVKAINKALIDNLPSIVDTIEEMLPDLVDAIIEIIVEINKASSKLMPHLMRLVFAIIRAILDIISDQEVIETSLDVLVDLVEQLIYQLVQNLPIFIPLIVKGILTLIGGIVRRIPEFVVAIVKGLVKAFKDMDWKKLVKECFKAFVDGIKGFFGIHSPSTMFQQFGIYMVQGLVNGLKNIWGNVSGIFSNLANNIGSFFTNLFSNVSSWVGSIGSKMSEIGSGVWDNISGFFSSLGSNISNALSSIFSSVSSWVGKIGSKISEIGSGIGSVVSSVGSKIGSGIGSVVGKIGSGIGSAVSSVGKKLKFWATGTENAPRGLSIVGEAGPELVDFRGGEKVYNAHNTEKMLAGGSKTNTFNVTFNNTSQTTAFTVMREMRRYSREMAFNGVL